MPPRRPPAGYATAWSRPASSARVPAAASRREILLELTESGQRLAAWIQDQRRTALVRVLDTISPGGRADLVRGLSEVVAG